MPALAPRHQRWLDQLADISDDHDLIPAMRPIGELLAALVAGMTVAGEAIPIFDENSGSAPPPVSSAAAGAARGARPRLR